MVEFNCVIQYKKSKPEEDSRELEKLRNMGIELDPGNYDKEEKIEEKIVKYAFDCSHILEVRETFVEFKGDFQPSVLVAYKMAENVIQETPPLLVSWEGFFKKIKEYNESNKKNIKTE